MDAALHREVLHRFTEPVIIADGSGTIRYANEAAGRLLEWSPADLQGRPLAVIVPRGMRGRHQAGFDRYHATRVPRVLGKTIRVPVLRRGGGEMRVELTIDAFGVPPHEYFAARLRELAGRGTSVRGDATPLLLKALQTASASLLCEEDAELVPARIAEILTTHFGAAVARVWRYQPESGWLCQPRRTHRRGTPPEPLKTDLLLQSDPFIVAEVARSRRPYVRNELAGLPEWDDAWLSRERLHSVAILPLVLAGRLLGVFAYFSADPISDELSQLLGLYAGLAAAALAQSEQQAARKRETELNREAAVLRALPVEVARSPSLAEALERLLHAGLDLLGLDQGLAALSSTTADSLEVYTCARYGTPIAGYRIANDGPYRDASRTGETQTILDYPAAPHSLPPLRQRGVRSALIAPLAQRDAAGGILQFDSKRAGRTFDAHDRQLAAALGALAGLAPPPEPQR